MADNIIAYLLECAETVPDKYAIAYKDRRVTFQELKQKAGQYSAAISTFLPNDSNIHPVGVLCSRDIEPIIAFLGVICSANYYVPLDPEMPSEKLQAILNDSNMRVIVGTEKDRVLLKNLSYTGSIITPESLIDSANTIVNTCTKETPLYMIYTSGSTGKPKGVLKSHGAQISFIEAYCDTFHFSEHDIIGNQTPFYFDAAAKDIYLMLKMGLTLEIIPSEYFPLPTELISYLNEKKITIASWVPTVLSIVAQLNPFSLIKPETLKYVLFVGEVMPMKHLNKWREALPDIHYVNLYGQSELCGICTYYKVIGKFENDSVLPMGKPLQNCKIYLVLDNKVITEPWQIGEMYIVSNALATEYFNDAEKTNACFTYRDFGEGLERCFKSGDLAQYDDEGNLVFASRIDYQIKHVGHRIELGEIETIAGSLSQVARCCCLYDDKKKRIVLFCKLTDGCSISGVELKSILKSKLSWYMVPNKVTILDDMPLNANGKIDRQLLAKMI